MGGLRVFRVRNLPLCSSLRPVTVHQATIQAIICEVLRNRPTTKKLRDARCGMPLMPIPTTTSTVIRHCLAASFSAYKIIEFATRRHDEPCYVKDFSLASYTQEA